MLAKLGHQDPTLQAVPASVGPLLGKRFHSALTVVRSLMEMSLLKETRHGREKEARLAGGKKGD